MNVFKLFGEISIDKSGAIKGIKDVEGQASKSSLAMQKTFNKLAKVAKVAMIAGAVAATAAIVKMTKDSIKAFAEFEEGMNEVFTLLPDITEKAMDSMKEDVKSLAKEMGILPDEIVPALYQAISAGVPRENVFDFMKVASTAAIGGVTDLETAVDGLTSIINAYGKENMTASDAADILFTAVRLGKTTMKELSDRLFQVNPIAAALGVKFEDVAAAMAEITAAGVPTRVAATQLRQMFMELSKAGSDVALTFEAVAGKSFQDFIAEGNNVGDALQLLTDYAEENDIKMQDMFGSVEAGQAVLALTGTHLDSYTAKIAEMDNAAGAADLAHAKMEGGLKRTWAKIQAWWATVKIDLGEKLQAPLERLMDWLDDNREKIEDGITSIFDKLIAAAEWTMDNSDKVAKGLKGIAIAFGAIIAVKFVLWAAAVIKKMHAMTVAIGVVKGTGLLGVVGFLGATFATTAAILLLYNQRTGESADITRDLTDETIELMELDWLGLREDLLGIAVAAGITEEDLFALTDALETAFLASIEAPDPATARKLYTQYVDAIFTVYEQYYPELGALRAKWDINFQAEDEAAAAARVELERTTGYEIVKTVEDTNRSIIENTRIRQAVAAAAAITSKALLAEEKTWVTKLREEYQGLAKGLDWINYVAVKIKDFSENVIGRITDMFTTNLQAQLDYNDAVKKVNDDFILDKQQLTTDYKTELGKLETAYNNDEISHDDYIEAKKTVESSYLEELKTLQAAKQSLLDQEAQAYRDQRIEIGDVLAGMLRDFFNYLTKWFQAKAAAALGEAIVLTIGLSPLAIPKYAEAAGYAALAVATSLAGLAATSAIEAAARTGAAAGEAALAGEEAGVPIPTPAPTPAPTPIPEPTPEPISAEEIFRTKLNTMLDRIETASNITMLAVGIGQLQAEAISLLGAGTASDYLGMSSRAASAGYQDRAYSRMLSAIYSFAEGGLIGKISEPILAMLGEGRHEEVVLPLSRPVFRELGEGILSALSGIITPQPALAVAGGGGITINIDNLAVREEADIRRIAVEIVDLTEEEKRAQGRDSLL